MKLEEYINETEERLKNTDIFLRGQWFGLSIQIFSLCCILTGVFMGFLFNNETIIWLYLGGWLIFFIIGNWMSFINHRKFDKESAKIDILLDKTRFELEK